MSNSSFAAASAAAAAATAAASASASTTTTTTTGTTATEDTGDYLDRKLELLESRFTQPIGLLNAVGEGGGVVGITTDPNSFASPLFGIGGSAGGGGDGDCEENSNLSEHSFSFSGNTSNTNNTNSNPQLTRTMTVRKKQIGGPLTSLDRVSRAAERHMRKVAATSPVNGNNNSNNALSNFSFSSNNSGNNSGTNSNNSNSQQTVVTGNKTQTQSPSHSQLSQSSTDMNRIDHRVAAESPPVLISPLLHKGGGVGVTVGVIGGGVAANTSTPTTTNHKKPNVARALLINNEKNEQHQQQQQQQQLPKSTGSATKRKSVPKRKISSIQDRLLMSPNNNNSNKTLSFASGTHTNHTTNTTPTTPTKKLKSTHTHTTTAAAAATALNSATTSSSRSRSPLRSSSGLGLLSDHSRDRSNGVGGGGNTKKPKSLVPPPNNKSIHDFFSAATHHTKKKHPHPHPHPHPHSHNSSVGTTSHGKNSSNNSNAVVAAVNGTPTMALQGQRNNNNANGIATATTTTASTVGTHQSSSSSSEIVHSTTSSGTSTKNPATATAAASAAALVTEQWQTKYSALQQQLQDKEEQLKAVTGNKTILHTALQQALTKTRKELQDLHDTTTQERTQRNAILEETLRWKFHKQAQDLRVHLSQDGNRLGKIVSTRAGMRVIDTWEEGSASKDWQARKEDWVKKHRTLLERQDHLKQRLKTQQQQQQQQQEQEQQQPPPDGGIHNNNNDNNNNNDKVNNNNTAMMMILSSLEIQEAKESIQMHLETLCREEQELLQEEKTLNEEKSEHIRALKRVASEDASGFRAHPKLHNRYVLECVLGKGGFSEVWKGYDLQTLREVAVKIHQLDPRWPDSKKENYTKHVAREYEIHRNVRHARIVSLYDVFEIDNNSFATVLECCQGTDLDTLLKRKKRLPERQARAILLQILTGMQYLSQPSTGSSNSSSSSNATNKNGGDRQGIIHYDLKPGNILFDEFGDAKITDFGLSKIVDTPDSAESMELTSQGAGTYWYLPPECFVITTSEQQPVRISNKVDVWSIGVIFYQMLYGKRPFGEGQSQDKLLADHTMLNAQEVQIPNKPVVSEKGKEFVKQCLMYDQTFRPTIAQLCEHPYVLQNNMNNHMEG